MTNLRSKVLRLAIEVLAFLSFCFTSVVMIVSVFTIAVLNIPDEVVFDFCSKRSVLVVMMLMAGPQLILVQTIVWWYKQHQNWREGFSYGAKSD